MKTLADECDSILEQGVRNTYTSLSTGNLQQAFSQAICAYSNNSESSGSGGGLGLSLPIKGIEVGFNADYDANRIQSIQSGSCNNMSTSLSDQQYHSVLSMVADPRIVEAWSQCKQNSGGTYINAKLRGNLVTFDFKFRATGSKTSATINSPPQFIGVACPPEINVKEGFVLTGVTRTVVCPRMGSGEVVAVLNTDWDSATSYIPPLAAEKPVLPKPTEQQPVRITPLPGSIGGPPRMTPLPGSSDWTPAAR